MVATEFVVLVASISSTFLLFVKGSRFMHLQQIASKPRITFASSRSLHSLLSTCKRIKMKTSKEETVAPRTEAREVSTFTTTRFRDIPAMRLNNTSSTLTQTIQRDDALPHFAFMNRIHSRFFGTVEFRCELRQVRE